MANDDVYENAPPPPIRSHSNPLPWRTSPFPRAAGVWSMAANQIIFWPFVLATDNLS